MMQNLIYRIIFGTFVALFETLSLLFEEGSVPFLNFCSSSVTPEVSLMLSPSHRLSQTQVFMFPFLRSFMLHSQNRFTSLFLSIPQSFFSIPFCFHALELFVIDSLNPTIILFHPFLFCALELFVIDSIKDRQECNHLCFCVPCLCHFQISGQFPYIFPKN